MVNNLGFEEIPLHTSFTAVVLVFPGTPEPIQVPSMLDYSAKMIMGDDTQSCNSLRLPSIPSISDLTGKGGAILQDSKMGQFMVLNLFSVQTHPGAFPHGSVLFLPQVKHLSVGEDERKARSIESWVLVSALFPAAT